jgi:predicted RNase H-like HicB family nuclease
VYFGEALKTIISVKKEGKFYVATDLVTNVADQGSTEEEAISRLKQGLIIILSATWNKSIKGRTAFLMGTRKP